MKRYEQLVREHMNVSEALSAGLKSLPNKISSFASTQAAWRFYKNTAISLAKLQAPLTVAAHEGVAKYCQDYALCVHDWSRLSYKHANKVDTYAVTHATDIGYDLQTSLLLSDQTGLPLAPVALGLVNASGSYATYGNSDEACSPPKNHLDEVSDCIEYLEHQGFTKPLVHLIDREGDSIRHIRRWHQGNAYWLVRAKDNPTLDYQGQSMACKAVAQKLDYQQSREVIFQGKRLWQWVGQTDVILKRPAKPSQKKIIKPLIPGEPIMARLVVCRVLSETGETLAEWLLLTNVATVEASTVALWYYWRWQIESFFKLLKSAGHQLEAWQQESALAIVKRLLVVSMACVTVWAIAADNSKQATELKSFLVKLSGRQMRYKTEFTHPALLAGLWSFLSMLEVMENYSSEELNELKETALQFLQKDV